MNLSLLGSNFWDSAGVLIILLVLVVVMFTFSYFRNKKYRQETEKFKESLEVGTKIKTYSGLYGKIVKIEETTDGRIATIDFSTTETPILVEMDMNAVYGVDNKRLISEVEEEERLEREARLKELEEAEKNEATLALNAEVSKEEAKAEEKETETKAENVDAEFVEPSVEEIVDVEDKDTKEDKE